MGLSAPFTAPFNVTGQPGMLDPGRARRRAAGAGSRWWRPATTTSLPRRRRGPRGAALAEVRPPTVAPGAPSVRASRGGRVVHRA